MKKALVEYLTADKNENKKEASSGMANMMASFFSGETKAAQDPVAVMKEVFKDDDFDEDEKMLLFLMSKERFKNRRRMAYVSLSVLVLATLYIALIIFLDGSHASKCDKGFDANYLCDGKVYFVYSTLLEKNSELLQWLGGFFTSIIALYFGAASFRPTS